MIASVILALTVFRKPPAAVLVKPAKSNSSLFNDGFNEIISTGSALRKTIRLKKQVDSIAAKKMLNNTDSALLLNISTAFNKLTTLLTNQRNEYKF